MPLADGQDESSPVLAILDREDACPRRDVRRPGRRSIGRTLQLHEQVRRFRHQMAGRFHAESLIGSHPCDRAGPRADRAGRAQARASVLLRRSAGRGQGARRQGDSLLASAKPGHSCRWRARCWRPNLLRSTLRSLWLKHSATSGQSATVLLEDVDRMPAEAQEELVGLLRSDPPRVRVIATTDKPLAELVAEGEFSQRVGLDY